MDIKPSNISFEQKNKMYRVDLWLNTRFFDSIIYSYKWIKNIYWRQIIWENLWQIVGNYICGFTELSLWKIIYIFDIDTQEEIHRFVQDARLCSFSLQSQEYYILIYLDRDGNIDYYTNYKERQYKIICEKNKISVLNTIFQTSIFEENFNLQSIFENKIFKIPKGTSIADIFLFEKFSEINNSKEIISDILSLNNQQILYQKSIIELEIKNIWNIVYINIFSNWDIEGMRDINKLLVSLNNKNILAYIHDNKEIQNIFSDYEDVSQLEFQEFNFDFQIPDNIFNYEPKYIDFHKNMLKLQYILYLMKYNYQKIQENSNEKINIDNSEEINKTKKIDKNSFVNIQFMKLNIQKENLEKNILHYENKYWEFLNIIEKLKK